MSHYTTHYDGLEGQAKIDRGLADIRDWLGNEKFEEIDRLFRELPDPMPYSSFKMALLLSGIQGYPLVAWHTSLWGEGDFEEEEGA